jgi:hypothetical protein
MKQERIHTHGDFSPPSRRHCDTCAQERIFQNYRCLTCGVAHKKIGMPAHHKWQSGKERLRRLSIYKQRRIDKAEYYRRKAEEARQKFEGSK